MDKNASEVVGYERSEMQKDIILQRLRNRGCRITKQRMMLLDIILNEECSCCKEIYYKASKLDPNIGTATVYRMINTLEEIGAIQNRLEHTINNLQTTSENTSAAESRIRDVDMATEMVEYSKNNILAQAGQSMLAQANQATQGVLSLLQ